jgi:hypothetical protein
MPKDRRDMTTRLLEYKRLPLPLSDQRQPRSKRTALRLSTPRLDTHQTTQQRRQRTLPRLHTQHTPVERHRYEQPVRTNTRAIEKLKTVLCGERADSCAAHASTLGLTEASRHATGELPRPPSKRTGAQAARGPFER